MNPFCPEREGCNLVAVANSCVAPIIICLSPRTTRLVYPDGDQNRNGQVLQGLHTRCRDVRRPWNKHNTSPDPAAMHMTCSASRLLCL